MRIGFGDCLVDLDTRELFRRGQPVHLSPKAFRLLELLLEGRPRAFSKSEIHQKIWPDSFVSEATLASLVAEIREAIGDDKPGARALRTVHGFGYAFAAATGAPVEPHPGTESTWRLVWDDEHEAPLPEGETILGRDSDAGFRIPSRSVSRHHARIVIAGNTATLEDLGSKNGTFVRGEKLTTPRRLEDGDSVRLGKVVFVARSFADGSTATEIEALPARTRKGRREPR